MRRDVPSLSLLQAFEAAARHQSFTRAAEELRVSQSAISRHVRTLEDQLGVALVSRTTRRFDLTTAGEAYFPEVRGCLDRIESSTRQVLAHRKGVGTLNLATMPTFGAKWLVPRMPGFIEKYPGIRINFFIRTEPFEFSGTEFDAGISFGTPTWPNVVAERLMGEELVTVSSPALARRLARSGPEGIVERIASCRLLHLSPLMEAWPRWFEFERDAPEPERGGAAVRKLRHVHRGGGERARHRIGAAFSGARGLRSGRLSIPHAHTIRTNIAYFVVYPAFKRNLPAVKGFAEWVLAAAASTEAECIAALAAARG